MSIEHLQVIQFIILFALIFGVTVQLVRIAVKFKIHRAVYGKGLESYIEKKTLEKQFQINRAREMTENK